MYAQTNQFHRCLPLKLCRHSKYSTRSSVLDSRGTLFLFKQRSLAMLMLLVCGYSSPTPFIRLVIRLVLYGQPLLVRTPALASVLAWALRLIIFRLS